MEVELHIRNQSRSILKPTGQRGTWPVSTSLHSNPPVLNCKEEHHISTFDSASFFSLHDYDDNGSWDKGEILKTYGMDDPSAKDVPQEKKDEVIREVMKLMDQNSNGIIERQEWMQFTGEGRKGTLPDFGLGPGHHWDIEMEYEIHHWELYQSV
jgi:hypothetical protein